MKAGHVCEVCGEMFSYDYPPNQIYCLNCRDAMNRADYATGVLIRHLIKRIEKLEDR